MVLVILRIMAQTGLPQGELVDGFYLYSQMVISYIRVVSLQAQQQTQEYGFQQIMVLILHRAL